jgi:hypothetical protein
MNAETVVAQSPVSALDGVFDALVKAVAERIVVQMMESVEVEAKISSVLETLLSDKVEQEIDSWFANNFSIHDYDHEINQMIDVEDEVRNIIKDMSFTVSVD